MEEEFQSYKNSLSEFEKVMGDTESIFNNLKNKKHVSEDDRKILEKTIKAFDDVKDNELTKYDHQPGILS
jgi:hypothetical protein